MSTRIAAAMALALTTSITGCSDGSAETRRAPRTLTIVADISKSAPLLAASAEDRAIFGSLAADHAAATISRMQLGDTVAVQYVGERSLANLRTLREPLSRRARAPQMAQDVAALIRSMDEAGIDGQPWTQLTRFLTIGEFGCAAGGEILLLSDGIESTPGFDERALLAGKIALPAPRPSMLAGCTLTIFGLGMTGRGPLPVQQSERLRAAWEQWAAQAGARIAFVELQ